MSGPPKSMPAREFKSDLPEYVLENLPKDQRYLCEQASIHRQQNEAILTSLERGETRFEKLEDRMEKNETKVEGLVRWKYWVMGICAGIGFSAEKISEWFGGHKH